MNKYAKAYLALSKDLTPGFRMSIAIDPTDPRFEVVTIRRPAVLGLLCDLSGAPARLRMARLLLTDTADLVMVLSTDDNRTPTKLWALRNALLDSEN